MYGPLQQVDRTCVIWRGQRFSYFAGCDYFRLSSHPAVIEAVNQGLIKYGLNVAASRLTTGEHFLYTQLEAALSTFFGANAPLLVGNGYATNLIVAQALSDDFSHVLIDARAHASLRDATRFFRCPVHEFKHRDAADLARKIKNKSKPLILTDGVFSHDGEIAPLPQYLDALPRDGTILLDDAHSAGVLGARGAGTPDHFGLLGGTTIRTVTSVGASGARDRVTTKYSIAPERRIIQTVTLSKAFGVYGGAILCPRALRQKIASGSPMFAGTTPIPLPLANAALTAIELLRNDQSLRARLAHNVDHVKNMLRAKGMPVPETPAPIVSLIPGGPREANALSKTLLSRNIFPSFIRYPGGQKGGYFRFVISSEHSREQLDNLIAALSEGL
jgi:8-amino-7-oxononanoate synthase